MKILLCHNYYQTRAGEGNVFEAERKLLIENGHQVFTYTRDSQEIANFGLLQKLCFFLKAFYNPSTSKDIAKLVDQIKPDVAHVHNVFPLISPSIYIALKKAKVPVVQTIHNFRFLCPNGLLFSQGCPCQPKKYRFFKCIFKKCYRESFIFSAWYASIILVHRILRTFQRNISHFIYLNDFSKNVFAKNGFADNKTLVKPNSADNITLDAQGSHDYLVYVGRFSVEKGIMTLMQALTKIPSYKVVIVGDGPQKQEVIDFIAQNKLTKVELTGYITHAECVQYMAGALAAVFPYECYENCPLTIVNSLWQGTPVVAADIGGVSSFVPAHAGWLVKSGDANDLSKRLEWVVNHVDQVNQLRAPAQKWAQDKFSAQRNYQTLIDIYNSVI